MGGGLISNKKNSNDMESLTFQVDGVKIGRAHI